MYVISGKKVGANHLKVGAHHLKVGANHFFLKKNE